MLKKIAFAGVGIALLASPLVASADTISDIQAKVRELVAQLQQLKAQLAAQGTTPAADDGGGAGIVNQVTRICPQILRTLDQGISGSDVKELQAYLGVSQTGYFGPMTARAVAAFQAEEGLSQVGIVGPMTRAAFARRCGWGNRTFTVSPTSGKAPLEVVFSNKVSGLRGLGSYTVDFGDGQSAPAGACYAPLDYCQTAGQNTHTYTANGTFTAKLIYQPPAPICNAPPGAACMTVLPLPQTIATVMIRVGSEAPSCPVYSPPICNENEQLVVGDVGSDGCQRGPRCVPKIPTTPGAPSINGIDGPASIATGATGLWTVRASVPNNTNTQLRYSVIWGDEGVLDQIRAFGNVDAGVLQTTGTFTHAYARAGTFRPTFTVSNTFGSAQTGVSVVVGGGGTDACTAWYRVCPAGTHNGGRCDQDCIPDVASSAFSATPTSGAAPLTVAFRALAGDEESFSIAFGDGVSAAMSVIEGGAARGVSHTYTANGTYTATLTKFTTSACAAGLCATSQVAGTVTIQVGGGSTSSGTFTATPKEGDAPLMVTFTGVGNSLSFGDGGPTFVAAGNGNLGTMTHVYLGSGNYTASSNGKSMNITVSGKRASFIGATAPNLCVYANKTYTQGVSVDVPVWSCGFDRSFSHAIACGGAASATGITPQRYTCRSGQWIDPNGLEVGQLVNATSCVASDGATVVGNGQLIAQWHAALAFDLSRVYDGKVPTMKCDKGTWLSCDASGNNCTLASAETNTNLASALTALESAIKAFIANLGQ